MGSGDREPPARLLDEGGQGGAERATGYGHDVIAVQTGELHPIDRYLGERAVSKVVIGAGWLFN